MKRVDLQPGVAVEEIQYKDGVRKGLRFFVDGPGMGIEFTMQPDGVIKLVEYLESLVE